MSNSEMNMNLPNSYCQHNIYVYVNFKVLNFYNEKNIMKLIKICQMGLLVN